MPTKNYLPPKKMLEENRCKSLVQQYLPGHRFITLLRQSSVRCTHHTSVGTNDGQVIDYAVKVYVFPKRDVPRQWYEAFSKLQHTVKKHLPGKEFTESILHIVEQETSADYIHIQVKPFINGPSMARLIREQFLKKLGGPTLCFKLLAARTLVGRLSLIHQMGLVHADFKPEQVMFERDRRGALNPMLLRLIDFDSAWYLAGEQPVGLMSNVMSPCFAPPEYNLHNAATPWWDVYGLGVSLIEWFTGNIPCFKPTNLDKMTPAEQQWVNQAYMGSLLNELGQARAMMTEFAKNLKQLGADPRDLINLLCLCLSPDPDSRPSLALLHHVLDRLTLQCCDLTSAWAPDYSLEPTPWPDTTVMFFPVERGK